MNTFTFKAKQNQQNLVVRVLSQVFNVLCHQKLMLDSGDVIVSCVVPPNVSKNSMNQVLFDADVPGTKEKHNTPILNGSDNDIIFDSHIGFGKKFKRPVRLDNGKKKLQSFQLVHQDMDCTCCDGLTVIEKL